MRDIKEAVTYQTFT